MVWKYIAASALSVSGAAIFFYGFKKLKKCHLIKDTPTSKIRSIAMGLVEISGNAWLDKYLSSPFSGSKCVYYRFETKEYRAHTSTDSKGHTRTTYSWDTIDSGEKRSFFYARDDTGSVLIDPKSAEMNIGVKKIFLQKSGFRFSNLKSLFTKQGKTSSSSSLIELAPNEDIYTGVVGDRKHYEYFIGENDLIYILGTASVGPKSNHVIKQGDIEKTFIISSKSEKELLKSTAWQSIGLFVLGGIMIVAGMLIFIYV